MEAGPPNTHPDPRSDLLRRIEEALDRLVRPDLRADGSEVEVVGVDADQIVQVRLSGACQGCSSSAIMLAMMIESTLKAEIPEIRFLEPVP